MNERIKAVLEKGGIPATIRGTSISFTSIDPLEKLVELVVKECIDYCGENLSKTVGGALKIHFGIEE
jgi:hypothetical protein